MAGDARRALARGRGGSHPRGSAVWGEAAMSTVMRCVPGYDTRERRWRHLDTMRHTALDRPGSAGELWGARGGAGGGAVGGAWLACHGAVRGVGDRQAARGELRSGGPQAVPVMGRGRGDPGARRMARAGADPAQAGEADRRGRDLVPEASRVCDGGERHGRRRPCSTWPAIASRRPLDAFYRGLKRQGCARLTAVVMDMWAPHIASTRQHLAEADAKIVFDRFHVASTSATQWTGCGGARTASCVQRVTSGW